MTDGVIGMMEGAFFVPKSEILNWINSLLQLNLTRIEQLGTGSAYCQIIEVLYPGTIKLNKLNWKARNEWEFISNLKILQQSFQKNNIKKYIEMEKLAKAKYQDNLEFAQWLKRYFDLNNGPQLSKDYDAQAKRGNIETEFGFLELRDNSRMAAMRGQRNEQSADQKLQKKMITRSKSPINNPYHGGKSGKTRTDDLQKKQLLREKDLLLTKFNEIHAIISSPEEGEQVKLKQILEISNYIQSLELKLSTQNDEINSSFVNNRQSIDRFQHAHIIKEEESPPKSDKKVNPEIKFTQLTQPNPYVIKNNSNQQNTSAPNPTAKRNTKQLDSQISKDPNISINSINGIHDDQKSEKTPIQKATQPKPSIDKEIQKKQALARINKHSEVLKQKIN